MGPGAGTFVLILGILCVLGTTAGMLYYFYMHAINHEEQPEKYVRFVHIGLLTIAPTAALIGLVVIGVAYNDLITYGWYDEAFFFGFTGSVAVSYAVNRGSCKATWRQLPLILSMVMLMATGFITIEVGRVARGKGYNDLSDVKVLNVQDSGNSGNAVIITLLYQLNNGRDCQKDLRMDCSKYNDWRGLSIYDDDDGNNNNNEKQDDDMMDDIAWYFNYNWPSTTDIQTEITNDFVCGKGATSDDDGVYSNVFYAKDVLINVDTCNMAWYTDETSWDQFDPESPTEALWYFGFVAVGAGIIFGSWQLCKKKKPTADEKEVELLPDSETQEECLEPNTRGVVA